MYRHTIPSSLFLLLPIALAACGADPVPDVAVETPPDAGPAQVTLTLVQDSTAPGRVSVDGVVCEASPCEVVREAGEVVILEASPALSSRFTGWTGDSCGDSPICEFLLETDTVMAGRFEASGRIESQRVLGPLSAPTDSAVDAEGNLYVVGSFAAQLPLGGVLSSSAGIKGYIAKFSPEGEPLWSQIVAPLSHTRMTQVAVGPQGEAYVYYTKLGHNENGTLIDRDVLQRIRPVNGHTVWSKELPRDDFYVYELAVTGLGYPVLLAQLERNNAFFMAGTLLQSGDRNAIAAIAFTSDGGVLHAHQFGQGLAFTVSDIYNAIPSDTGGLLFTVTADSEPRLVELSETGALVANDAVVASGRIAHAPGGGLYVAGHHVGPISWGEGPLLNAPSDIDEEGRNLFVGEWSAAGAPVWVRSYGGSADEVPRAIEVNEAGDLFVSIYADGFGESLELGGPRLPTFGWSDMALVSLSPTGEHRWSKSFGTDEQELIRGMWLREDRVLLLGELQDSIHTELGLLEYEEHGDSGRPEFKARPFLMSIGQ